MKTGILKTYLAARRMGFIVPDNGGADVLVGDRALDRAGIRELSPGDTISFDSECTAKGERVTRIHSVERATSRTTTPRRLIDLTEAA